MRADGAHLFDILETSDRIAEYISGAERSDFLAHNMMKAAVVREIEIIGEATHRIMAVFKDNNPGVPSNDPSVVASCDSAGLIHTSRRDSGNPPQNGAAIHFIGIREKFGRRYPFTEYNWAQGPPFGTACPLDQLEPCPELLAEQNEALFAELEDLELPWIDAIVRIGEDGLAIVGEYQFAKLVEANGGLGWMLVHFVLPGPDRAEGPVQAVPRCEGAASSRRPGMHYCVVARVVPGGGPAGR